MKITSGKYFANLPIQLHFKNENFLASPNGHPEADFQE
jgi:hypothetical protein